MEHDNETELRRQAAAALGRARTPKKAASSRQNGRAGAEFGHLGGRPPKPLEELTCTCGHCPDAPRSSCPRGRAIKRRQK